MPKFFALVFCCFFLQGLLLCASIIRRTQTKPNIVLIFADDLGYGDISSYGHPYATTPYLDTLSRQGLTFTDFYSASPVCAPSRAALLTGRFQIRSGVYPGVFVPTSIGGLPLNETTMAEYAKQAGYSTAIVGKWHLGVGRDKEYLPINQGFDYFLGTPYGISTCECNICFYPNEPCLDSCLGSPEYPPCPLVENTEIIEQPVHLPTLEEKMVNAATNFIKTESAKGNNFFLYYAFNHPHTPQYAGQKFTNSSIMGRYGDAMNELDNTVGEIMRAIRDARVYRNTFVFFTSDNGPALSTGVGGGIPGPFKCGKVTTYEGGVREPAIAWWPGVIRRGKTSKMASTLDLLPTMLNLMGVEAEEGVTLDGYDMGNILFNRGESLRDTNYFYNFAPDPKDGIFAVRYKQHKAHFITQGDALLLFQSTYPDPDCSSPIKRKPDPPLLFDLYSDASEVHTLTPDDPTYNDTMSMLTEMKDQHNANVVWGQSQIERGEDPSIVLCAKPGCTPFPSCCSTDTVALR